MSLAEIKTRDAPLLERPQLKLAEAPVARPEAQLADAKPAKKSRLSPRKAVFGALLIALLGGAGWYGYDWYTTGRFMVSTDDAYVKADMSALSAKVAGYVADLPVPENTLIKAGTVILKLEDGDFRLAVASAKDRISLQNAVNPLADYHASGEKSAIGISHFLADRTGAENLNGIGRRRPLDRRLSTLLNH